VGLAKRQWLVVQQRLHDDGARERWIERVLSDRLLRSLMTAVLGMPSGLRPTEAFL